MSSRLLAWAKGLAVSMASVVALLALAEVAIRISGAFAPLRQAVIGGEVAAAGAAADGDGPTPGVVLHPYLGYAQRAGTELGGSSEEKGDAAIRRLFGDVDPRPWLPRFAINAQGFASDIRDYRTLDRSKIVIAIFGGSVADIFAVMAQGSFRHDLAGDLGVDESSIEIVDFAKGGYKQPQQLIALVQAILMGIPIDLVVNIDGFNEVAMGGGDCARGYDPLMPSGLHYLTALDLLTRDTSIATLEGTLSIARDRQRELSLQRLANGPWLSRSETAKAVLGAMIERLRRQRAATEQQMQAAAAAHPRTTLPIVSPDDRPPATGETCLERVADIWLRSSLLMAALARQIGVPYVHVLQPNQYVAGSKEMNAEELGAAWTPDAPTAQLASAGYPLLVQRSPQLEAAGVPFLDFTQIFNGHPETIYIDTCCHYHYRGNRLLFEKLRPTLRAHLMKEKSA